MTDIRDVINHNTKVFVDWLRGFDFTGVRNLHFPIGIDHRQSGTLTLRAERQSARMSKITNDDLTRSGTRYFIAVPIWQQWASKG